MKRPPQIPINQFQLAILLNDEQKQDFQFLLDEGVICAHCGGLAPRGMVVTEMYLTSLNDLLVQGTCKVCNGKAARVMEFGEDKEFCEKANNFRKAIQEKGTQI